MCKMVTLFEFAILACVYRITVQVSTPDDNSYVAAVVEFQVSSNNEANLIQYENFIRQAKEQDADIIVFPELTLARDNVSIPVPIHGSLKQNAPVDVPELYHEVLVRISKSARDSQIYVVINFQEQMDCTTNTDEEEYCPENKIYLFNTNVVFNRNGYVIDRYRKITLSLEPGRSPALKPDLGIFTTDFGVTFGHFISFDLMFQVPTIQIIEKMNVTDVLYTTMWFSALPFLTAIQIQQAYAHSMDINFMAAGANSIPNGSAGSGIYSGKQGVLVSTMTGLPETALYIARVPKVPGTANWTVPGSKHSKIEDLDHLYLITDSSVPSYVTKPLVRGYQEFSLVDHDVTCRFRIQLKQNHDSGYYYRAAVFDGVRVFASVETGGMRMCGIISCMGSTKDTCGKRFSTYERNLAATFDQLDIIAFVPTPKIVESVQAKDSAYFPVSLTPPLIPLLPETDFSFNVTGNSDITEYSMSLLNFDVELYTFAVWGRNYERDGQDATDSLIKDETDAAIIGHYFNYFLLFFLILFLVVLK